MQFEIPDGAHVHIVIGKAPPLALTDETGGIRRHKTVMRPMIKGAVLAVLVCSAFVAGKQFGTVRTIAPAVAAAPAASAGRPAAGGLPPEFTQQLQQPPIVTPPPAPAAPGRNSFGLER